MFDHPLVRRCGPFSRIGSLVNVVIVSGITFVNIGSSRSDFERTGMLAWGVFMMTVFVVTAIVVWVRWARRRSRLDDSSDAS